MKRVSKEALLVFGINYFFSPFIGIWCKYSTVRADWGRRVKRQIQFPIVDFENSQGLRIKFIAISHFATKEYYEMILRKVSEVENEGASVIYESLKTGKSDTEEARNRINVYRDHPLFKVIESESLVRQTSVLIPKESWINADLTLEECLGESRIGRDGGCRKGLRNGSIWRR